MRDGARPIWKETIGPLVWEGVGSRGMEGIGSMGRMNGESASEAIGCFPIGSMAVLVAAGIERCKRGSVEGRDGH